MQNIKENSRRDGVIYIEIIIFTLLLFRCPIAKCGDWAFFLAQNLTFHLILSIIYNISHYL